MNTSTTHPAPQLALIALSACPFCGGEAIATEDEDNHIHMITCNECGGSSDWCDSEEDAVSAWNTRATQSRPEAELPELPESYGTHCVWDSVRMMKEPGYTADQMRAYGQQCAATGPAEVGGDGKDAARYRWMRERGLGFTHDDRMRGISTTLWGHWPYDTAEGFGLAIDNAIDEAMRAEKAPSAEATS